MKISKNKEVELHNIKYEELKSQNPEFIFKPRVKILSNFQKNIKRIYGNVLDIGGGTGYASIWLAKNSDAKKIICLETSVKATENLIPNNIKYFNVQNKVETLLGSFEELKFENYFDFIISMGSLHYSNCLFTSMKSLNRALKNKGFLIMNEPSMKNKTSNEEYVKKYNSEEIFNGIKIKNYERNDKFYREAEYITSAVYAGFDLKHNGLFENKISSDSSKNIYIIKDLFLKKKFLKLFTLSIAYPFKRLKLILYSEFKKKFSNVNSCIYFFQKNKTDYIPHLWEKLK